MDKKYCERCGKELQKTTKGRYCRLCIPEIRKERHEEQKRKAIEARDKMDSGGSPTPVMAGEIPGKNRCYKRGHSFQLNCTKEVACGYIENAETYNLPRRPRPSASPNHCLYWSKVPTRAGWFTEEEKRKLKDPHFPAVVDTLKCKVYKNIDTAEKKTKVHYAQIKADCESTEDINGHTRFRYLAPEEKMLFKLREV